MRTITAKKNIPLIHLLNNQVTVCDVVNMILASGSSAICAEAIEEVEEITALSDALLINTGTPSINRLRSMLLAGQTANRLGIPVILDPVGAGASHFRETLIKTLLESIRFTCIRGNRSEIAALCNQTFESKGVDAAEVTLDSETIKGLARKTGSIIVATGGADILTDGTEVFELHGGSPLLTGITGSGCMLSGIIASFIAKADDPDIHTVKEALTIYKENAAEAHRQMLRSDSIGSASYKNALIDSMSRRYLHLKEI